MNNIIRFPLACLLLCFVGLPGCFATSSRGPTEVVTIASPTRAPSTPPKIANTTPGTARTKGLWGKASSALERRDKMTAIRHLERLIRLEGGSESAQEAQVELSQLAAEHRAYGRARRLARRIQPNSFRRLRSLALAFEGEENYREAAKTWLEAVKAATKDGDPPDEARRGAALNLFLDGKPAVAEETLPPDQRSSLPTMVESLLTPALVAKLYQDVGQEDPWHAWLALRHARASWRAGLGQDARQAALRARDEAQNPLVRREATELLRRLEAWNKVDPQRIGVLLPLSGDFKKIGAAAKAAIELALEGQDEFELVYRDTAGDPDRARLMAKELIFQEHVAAVLGPVGHIETAASIEVARQYHIPHLHLASHDRLGHGVPTVWRFRLSQLEQGATVARYAVSKLGLKRVAILYPDSGAGRSAMAGFWDEAVAQGAEIRAIGSYPTGEKDFSNVIAGLLHARQPGKGHIDFDALFLPAQSQTVRRLVPFLKYWGVQIRNDPKVRGTTRRPKVQLLGSSGWHHLGVIERGENLTDNAIFVTPFRHDPNDTQADEFVLRFHRKQGRRPLAFHAEVYDAARLLSLAMAGITGSDHLVRREVTQNFRGLQEVQGATGLHTVRYDGKIEREPWLMTIDLEEIRPRLPEAEEIERRRQRKTSSDGMD